MVWVDQEMRGMRIQREEMDNPGNLITYDFFAVTPVDGLQPGERLFLEIGDLPIVIFNVDGKFYSIGDICTHDNGPLGDGELEDHIVICPRHGAHFDICSGAALTLPAIRPTPSYPVRIRNGFIEIGIPGK
jgi:3-phenylpropionate/trans-cinnamate dioxygenase ferredoxin component